MIHGEERTKKIIIMMKETANNLLHPSSAGLGVRGNDDVVVAVGDEGPFAGIEESMLNVADLVWQHDLRISIAVDSDKRAEGGISMGVYKRDSRAAITAIIHRMR